MTPRLWLPVTAVVFVVIPALGAQRTLRDDAGQVTFEAATIKPHGGDRPKSLGTGAPGLFEANGVTLHELIAAAYGGVRDGRLADARIVMEPSWATSRQWDVVGKTSASEGLDRMFLMLQTLLRDRFGLRMDVAKQELPAYALVATRKDARPGKNLTRSEVNCADILPGVLASGQWPANVSWCGFRFDRGQQVHMEGKGVTLAELAARLEQSPSVARPVVDRTMLKGTFDFSLDFTALATPADPATDSSSATIFTALQEQLGLKLTATRASVQVLAFRSGHLPAPD